MEKYKNLILTVAVISVVTSFVFFIAVRGHYATGVGASESLYYAKKALNYYAVGSENISVRDTHIQVYDASRVLTNKDFSYALLLNFYPDAHAYNIKPIGTNAFILYGNKTDHFVVFYNYNNSHIYLVDASLKSGSGIKLAESPFPYQFAEYAVDPNGRYPR